MISLNMMTGEARSGVVLVTSTSRRLLRTQKHFLLNSRNCKNNRTHRHPSHLQLHHFHCYCDASECSLFQQQQWFSDKVANSLDKEAINYSSRIQDCIHSKVDDRNNGGENTTINSITNVNSHLHHCLITKSIDLDSYSGSFRASLSKDSGKWTVENYKCFCSAKEETTFEFNGSCEKVINNLDLLLLLSECCRERVNFPCHHLCRHGCWRSSFRGDCCCGVADDEEDDDADDNNNEFGMTEWQVPRT